MRKVWVLLFGFAALGSGIGGAQSASSQSGGITADDAVSLADLAVRHQIAGIKNHGSFSLDGIDPDVDPGFYSFQALGVWSSGVGSAVIGNYEVDRRTAEVWNDDTCKKVRFASLQKLQDKILHQANIDLGERSHGRLPGFCDFSKFPKGLR